MQIGQLLSGIAAQPQALTKLTDTQRETLKDILSRYDANRFTEDDFNALSAELRQAGIRPNAEVRAALETKGIDVDSFNPQPAGRRGPPPPPPPPPPSGSKEDNLTTLTEALLQAIAEFLAKLKTSSISGDDVNALNTLAQQSGANTTGLLVDEVA